MKSFSTVIFFLLILACVYHQTEAGCKIPGAPCDIDIKTVQEYLPMIEKAYNEKTSDPMYGRATEITSAKSQVVAGIRYIINSILSQTDCSKADVKTGSRKAAECKDVKSINNCVADIYVRSWENYKEVTEMKCGDVKTNHYKNS